MIPTATSTQTMTIMLPRRSAAFCFARISSTTFWRSLRAVLDDLDDLAMDLSSLQPEGREPGRVYVVAGRNRIREVSRCATCQPWAYAATSVTQAARGS